MLQVYDGQSIRQLIHNIVVETAANHKGDSDRGNQMNRNMKVVLIAADKPFIRRTLSPSQ